METLTELLERAAARYGDRCALTLESDTAPERWTYGALHEASEAIASHLRFMCGIPAGARVMTWSANSPRLVAAYFGCLRAGLVLVPIDPQSAPDFVARVAERTQAAAILVDGGREVPSTLPCLNLASLPMSTAGRLLPVDRPTGNDLAEIVFTSGTTGSPKGVMLTHANIVTAVNACRDVIPYGPQYRLLSLLPLSHMLEQTGGLYLPMTHGAQVSYLESRQPTTIFRANASQRVTTMVVVPLVLEVMLHGIEREVRRRGAWRQWSVLHRVARWLPMSARRLLFAKVRGQVGESLELFFCGGARLDPQLAETWERMGIKVVEGYGTTECAPVVTANELGRRHIGTIGRPLIGVQVRVAADGELQVRGPNVSPGYWNDEAATAAVFTTDGWYCTGDLAEQHGDDFVLKGRLRDLIVLANGMNVYPEDVESALRAEPVIADCVVYGDAGSGGQPRVRAIVLPAAERRSDGDLPEQIALAVQRANRQLAVHQRIAAHSTWAGEDFPRTHSMKIKRSEVIAASGVVSPARPAATSASAR